MRNIDIKMAEIVAEIHARLDILAEVGIKCSMIAVKDGVLMEIDGDKTCPPRRVVNASMISTAIH